MPAERLPRAYGRAWPWLLAALFAAAAGWWWFAPDTLPTALRHAMPPSPGAQRSPPPLYRWRDDKGRLNVTDVPPKDRPYETLRYHPDTNVVPAYKGPEPTP